TVGLVGFVVPAPGIAGGDWLPIDAAGAVSAARICSIAIIFDEPGFNGASAALAASANFFGARPLAFASFFMALARRFCVFSQTRNCSRSCSSAARARTLACLATLRARLCSNRACSATDLAVLAL